MASEQFRREATGVIDLTDSPATSSSAANDEEDSSEVFEL